MAETSPRHRRDIAEMSPRCRRDVAEMSLRDGFPDQGPTLRRPCVPPPFGTPPKRSRPPRPSCIPRHAISPPPAHSDARALTTQDRLSPRPLGSAPFLAPPPSASA